jgi:acetylornithine/succinyldiaminopimelate/putrescine aminotransferase
MDSQHAVFDTWDQLVGEQIPNFLRLYLNPFVVQTCLALNRYVQETWFAGESPGLTRRLASYQSFLANSFDEALSGAIKLARYSADLEGRPKAGLVFDPEDRLGPLASVSLNGQEKIEFIPDLVVIGKEEASSASRLHKVEQFGFVVAFPSMNPAAMAALDAIAHMPATAAPLVITCLDRPGLAACSSEPSRRWRVPRPAIVVFDESFVHRQVPFGTFTARKSLYDYWNARKNANFHSTTYQPNAVSTLHFLRCLKEDDPEFFARLSPQFERVVRDPAYRKFLFARLYSPSLARAAAAVGWDRKHVRAAGHYVTVDGQPVFDAVAGVACSFRGHNPPRFCKEIRELDRIDDYRQALANQLQKLTGLSNVLPAVSGASAVENALRIGLAAQFPRRQVLAFLGGFGGKTLLALTGTANAAYKRRIDPLYPHVRYVDPFGEGAIEELEAALRTGLVGVVQVELIQAVGGVRALPEKLLRHLLDARRRWEYLLFVDEVQTGMYRTGPFVRSRELGLEPDLLTVGKGTSDMMFPFAVTLYSDGVRQKLAAAKTDLPEAIRTRFDYEFGYKTLLNVLAQSGTAGLPERVREAGTLFEQLLAKELQRCPAVRDIRVFGLLLAIELDTRRWPRRWLGKKSGPVYVLNLLRHEPFALFAGYCQYEPHVLKLTPPLTITDEEIRRTCETLSAVLKRPTYALLPSLLGVLSKSLVRGKWEAYWHGRANRAYLER